jgi:hypothetical protein
VRSARTAARTCAILIALRIVATADTAPPDAKKPGATEKRVSKSVPTAWQSRCLEVLRQACIELSRQSPGFRSDVCSTSVGAKTAPGKYPEKLVTLGLVVGGTKLYVQAWAASPAKRKAYCSTEKWDRDFGEGLNPHFSNGGFEYQTIKGPADVGLYAEHEVAFGPAIISMMEAALDRCYCYPGVADQP